MKKNNFVITFALIFSFLPLAYCSEVVEVKVHPGVRYQEIEGFGTALGWWTNVVGGWDEPTRSDIVKLVFDKEEGLGLTVAKYYIGGTENPNCPADVNGVSHFSHSREMEGFKLTEEGPYDWTREANQRWVLQHIIKEYGIKDIEVNALTGPWWMTVSGCVSGHAETGVPNLKEIYYDDYVDYLVTIIKHFRDQWNVNFKTVSPFTEASQEFWKMGGNQEGCVHTNQQANRLVKLLGRKLDDAGLATTVSSPDEWSVGESIEVYNSFDDKAKSYISAIGTHSYWGSLRDRYAFRDLVLSENKKAIMSESSERAGMEDDHEGMYGALEQAWHLTTDIRDMGSHTWLWFEPVVNELVNLNYGGNWGGIHAYYSGPKAQQYEVTKTLSGVAQYTRFIRPGFVIVENSDAYTLSAYEPEDNKLIIVVYNDKKTNKKYNYSLSEFSSFGTDKAIRFRTTADHHIKKLQPVEIKDAKLTDDIPPESITTYILDNAVYSGDLYKNINNNVIGDELNQIQYSLAWSHWAKQSQIAKWCKVLEAKEYYKGYKQGLYSKDCHWSNTPGQVCTLKFRGKQIKIYGIKDSDYGTMIVSIDGKERKKIDCYSDNEKLNELLYTSKLLSDKEHFLEIKVGDKKNKASKGFKVAVDMIQVVNSD